MRQRNRCRSSETYFVLRAAAPGYLQAQRLGAMPSRAAAKFCGHVAVDLRDILGSVAAETLNKPVRRRNLRR
jgi:hypothetical protein